MLAKDIRIGGQYYTYVGENKVLVEVVQDRKTAGRRYLVKRVDNGLLLTSKLRAPSALHPAADQPWPAMNEKQERLKGGKLCGPQQSCFGPQTRGLGDAGSSRPRAGGHHYTIWRITSSKHEEKIVARPARPGDWNAQTQYQRIVTQVPAASAEEALQLSCASGFLEVEPVSLGAARRKGIPRVGTRVQFTPNPMSLPLYTNPPAIGEQGTVTTVSFGRKRMHYLPGPAGGLLYVKWDKAGPMGVSPMDVSKPGRSGMRVGPGRKGQQFSRDDVEYSTTLHTLDFD